MFSRFRRYISLAKREEGAGGGPYDNLLSTSARDSDSNSHTVSNVVLASGYHPLIVVATVLDKDGNSFTIFS
jgi:hypothetical protein